MTNHHTRKTFFAKALAAIAATGLLGSRLAAKTAPVSTPDASAGSAIREGEIVVRADARAVARSVDSV